MGTLCPYCHIEVSESSIEAEDGCCPECGSVITAASSIFEDDHEDFDNEFDDDFDDDDYDEFGGDADDLDDIEGVIEDDDDFDDDFDH